MTADVAASNADGPSAPRAPGTAAQHFSSTLWLGLDNARLRDSESDQARLFVAEERRHEITSKMYLSLTDS